MRRVLAAWLSVLLLFICTAGCAPVTEAPVAVGTPTDGIAYYLMHRDTGTMLAVRDGELCVESSPTGDVLWLFLPVEGDGYVAKNEATGAYLTVGKDGTVTLTDAQSNATAWRWERMRDGDARMSSDLSEGGFLSLSDGAVRYGATDDRWEIRPLTLRLNVYYDAAFAHSYAKKGMDPRDALEKILLENSEGAATWRGVTEFFRTELHAYTSLHITDAPYETYPYSKGCLYRDDPTVPCVDCFGAQAVGETEVDACRNGHHHKEATRFVESTPVSDREYNLLFTGHVASCYNKSTIGGTHQTEEESAIFGLAEGIADGNRCAIFLGAFSDILDYDHIKYYAVHEICHLLGARHHAPKDGCVHSRAEHAEELGGAEAARCAIPLCDACRALIDAEKAALLFGHAD